MAARHQQTCRITRLLRESRRGQASVFNPPPLSRFDRPPETGTESVSATSRPRGFATRAAMSENVMRHGQRRHQGITTPSRIWGYRDLGIDRRRREHEPRMTAQ